MKAGIGSFSHVFRGRWRRLTVAIKVLTDATPRELFKRKISIWHALSHRNLLTLFGAFSASGDPPWFLVSLYYKNESLVTFQKGRESIAGVNVLKMLYEIARGMAYLHRNNALHGDLKVSPAFMDLS